MSASGKRVFILLGMPGVGKGTQAQFIAQHYHLYHIDTGHCLRSEIASGSELGQTAKSYVDQGQLVPFELVMQVIKASMVRVGDEQQGFLFDGFPRNLDQADGLSKLLAELQLSLNAVLYLETPSEILMDRLAYRVTCGQCDTKYNLKLNPPKTPDACDRCGGALVTRKDDQPEVIGNRLKAYETETSPLIQFYQGHGVLHSVDANQPIEQVTQQIQELLDPFFNPTSDKMKV